MAKFQTQASLLRELARLRREVERLMKENSQLKNK